jgi:ferritin-like protein
MTFCEVTAHHSDTVPGRDIEFRGQRLPALGVRPRIYELGGKLPDDIRTFAGQAGCPDAYLPDSLGGAPAERRAASPQTQMGAYPRPRGERVRDLLTVLVEAERCTICTYTDICNYTAGKDHRTYELSLAILNEEVEHESWFSEFLGEGRVWLAFSLATSAATSPLITVVSSQVASASVSVAGTLLTPLTKSPAPIDTSAQEFAMSQRARRPLACHLER